MLGSTFNMHIIAGRVGRIEPMAKTKTGTSMLSLSVATESYAGKDDSGKSIYETEWHRIVLFGDTADRAEKSIGVGDFVLIHGKGRYHDGILKDGTKYRRYQIHADRFNVIYKRKGEVANTAAPSRTPLPSIVEAGDHEVEDILAGAAPKGRRKRADAETTIEHTMNEEDEIPF